jgi:septal ring factor EnvC (AmiA/AmiB activator)
LETLGEKLKNSLPRLENAPRPGLATWAIAVLLVGIALIIPVARAGATGDVDTLNSKISAAKSQAQALAGKMQANSEALAGAQSEASAAAAKEAQLTMVLVASRQRSEQLAEKLQSAEAKLRRTRAQFARSQKALSDRLVAIYTSSTPDSISVLLNSDGFDDLTTRAQMLGMIQDNDTALVSRVRSLRAQVAGRVDSVDAAKHKADAYTAQVSAAHEQIAAVRANAQARAAELASARAAQADSLASLQSNMGTWTKQVQKAEAAQQQAAVSQQDAADTVGGWMGDWAIPEAIVMCESGGNFHAVNPSSGAGGAYQILPSTWELYGGHGLPQNASPAEQSAIAAQIWADSGPGAWVCAQ